MILVAAVLALLILSFGGVILVGAPYLPTLTTHVEKALDLAELQPGQTLLELGCGDGKVVLAAARKGYRVVGYELNPFMALASRIRTWRYRKQVRIIWGDLWRANLVEADAIFVFLLPKFMEKLNKKVMQYQYKPVKLVSFAFAIPSRQPTIEAEGVFRYDYR